MRCLAAVMYDPTARASHSAASLLAMTAFNTTELRVTFTVPSSGNVMVRLKVQMVGTTKPQLLLGVLEGSTVIGRVSPMAQEIATAGNNIASLEGLFVVTGLTPGDSKTWDAAYGRETTSAIDGNIRYGGPDDNNVGNNADGCFSFEVWEA